MGIGGTENPAGASQSEPGDSQENSIPHSRVVEMVGKAKDEMRAENEQQLQAQEQRLRAEAAQMMAARPEAQPAVTRESLTQMVNEGTITQTQMDVELDRQRAAQIEQDIDAKVEAKVSERETKKKVQSEFDAYLQAMPSIKVRTSDEFRRAGVEMKKLMDEGHPNDLRTEVLAMKLAFGPAEALTRNPNDRETHEDGAGGDGGAETKSSTEEPGGPPKGLDARRKAYYEKEIARGIYTGWDDPMVVSQIKRVGA